MITGGFLTETARSLVLEGEIAKAWTLLSKGLFGPDGETVAIRVLKGEMKLVGDSSKGVRLVRETKASAARYQKSLSSVYAGRVRIRGCWYEPRAKVVRFDPESGHRASLALPQSPEDIEISELGGAVAKWWEDRARTYADEGEIVQKVRSDFYLFAPTSERPFWFRGPDSLEEALDEFTRSGRRIREIGEEADSTFPSLLTSPVPSVPLASPENWEEDRDWEEEERKRLEELRKKILDQAASDTFVLTTETGRSFTIPRAPFVKWALHRTSLSKLAPSWNSVSPVGLKLPSDNPDHTDWMIGAGADLQKDYAPHSDLSRASFRESFRIQEELGDFQYQVLSGGPEVSGVVGEDIFVLSDLRNTPENNAVLSRAKGLVSERGGELAHMSVVAREMKVPLFLVEEARKKFPEGERLVLLPSLGRIYRLGGEKTQD